MNYRKKIHMLAVMIRPNREIEDYSEQEIEFKLKESIMDKNFIEAVPYLIALIDEEEIHEYRRKQRKNHSPARKDK
jgi:hypothetical protein